MRYGAYILSVIEMMLINALNRGGGVFKALAIAAAATALTFSSESCKSGVENGVELCLKVLIPSLFPFMALSAMAVKSGACQAIGKPFGKITGKLFGLSGVFAPIIILSLIGGYPVGARGIAELKSSGAVSEKQAKKASLFAVCAGPGFLINFVGTSLYGNTALGLMILFAQVMSVFLLGILINLFDRDKDDYNSVIELSNKPLPFSSVIVESAYSAAKGMAQICALVLIFSAATGIIKGIFGESFVTDIWVISSEVCSAVTLTTAEFPFEITAFAAGFGGLCVHFQIFSALGDIKVNKALFFFIRIIQGFITALITKLLSWVFIGETAVFSSSEVQNPGLFGGSIVSAVALAVVSVSFLITIKNYRR